MFVCPPKVEDIGSAPPPRLLAAPFFGKDKVADISNVKKYFFTFVHFIVGYKTFVTYLTNLTYLPNLPTVPYLPTYLLRKVCRMKTLQHPICKKIIRSFKLGISFKSTNQESHFSCLIFCFQHFMRLIDWRLNRTVHLFNSSLDMWPKSGSHFLSTCWN